MSEIYNLVDVASLSFHAYFLYNLFYLFYLPFFLILFLATERLKYLEETRAANQAAQVLTFPRHACDPSCCSRARPRAVPLIRSSSNSRR